VARTRDVYKFVKYRDRCRSVYAATSVNYENRDGKCQCSQQDDEQDGRSHQTARPTAVRRIFLQNNSSFCNTINQWTFVCTRQKLTKQQDDKTDRSEQEEIIL